MSDQEKMPEGWKQIAFSAEDWGIIHNGLQLEHDRSVARKFANNESMSNYIADDCHRIIETINEAFIYKPQPEGVKK